MTREYDNTPERIHEVRTQNDAKFWRQPHVHGADWPRGTDVQTASGGQQEGHCDGHGEGDGEGDGEGPYPCGAVELEGGGWRRPHHPALGQPQEFKHYPLRVSNEGGHGRLGFLDNHSWQRTGPGCVCDDGPDQRKSLHLSAKGGQRDRKWPGGASRACHTPGFLYASAHDHPSTHHYPSTQAGDMGSMDGHWELHRVR